MKVSIHSRVSAGLAAIMAVTSISTTAQPASAQIIAPQFVWSYAIKFVCGYQPPIQNAAGAGFNMLVHRNKLSAGVGWTELTAGIQSSGKYSSEYVYVGVTRPTGRNASTNLRFEYRAKRSGDSPSAHHLPVAHCGRPSDLSRSESRRSEFDWL